MSISQGEVDRPLLLLGAAGSRNAATALKDSSRELVLSPSDSLGR